MSQFQDITIFKLMGEINRSCFLPDIQREFVWLSKSGARKIEDLFDSILRGYPIGTFLFWKIKKGDIATGKDIDEDSEKLNFQLYKFIERYDVRTPHNEKINIEQINADDLSIVLDGQQRLTALYLGLKGSRTIRRPHGRRDNPDSYEEKFLFLNLRHTPSDENPDDNYQFEFLSKDARPKTDRNNYWFRIGKILELDSVCAYSLKNKLSDKEVIILERMHRAFCTDGRIAYFAEDEKNLDKVLNIFIRVNSGGTQLSYSDLLMSILTATFSSDIRDQMNKFVDALEEKGFGVVGRDNVLKTCLLLTESDHKFLLRNFSKGNISKIENNWGRIQEAIFSAAEMLREFGYENRLSSGYVLSVVAYYLFKNGRVTQKDKKHLLKFVRVAQIQGYFRASLDAQLAKIANVVRESTSIDEVNEKLFASGDLLRIAEGDIDEMLERKYGDSATLPILQLLYPNLDFNNEFHIDHIYPKSKFNSDNPKLPNGYEGRENFLYNLQLLEGNKNQSKGSKDPEDWLREIHSGDEAQIKADKKRNYIGEDFSLEWKNVNQFEEKRNAKMKEQLKKVLMDKRDDVTT